MRQHAPARFAPLLGAQFLLILLSDPLAQLPVARNWATLLFPITLAGLILAVGRSGRAGRVAMVLWIGSLGFEIAVRATRGPVLPVAGRAIDATLVALGIGILVAEILRRQQRVTFDTLLGGVAVYMMIGFFFFQIFDALEFLVPGSFQDRGVPVADLRYERQGWLPDVRHPGFLYYSFVTLTTLGYGDIVPHSPLARSLAAIEALLGQIYLTVLVAALVGMHLSQRIERHESRESDEGPPDA
jgi:hypothetical protein